MKFNFSNTKILVIGDIMLDKYLFGRVNRISPEAPVPVVKVESTQLNLGGAGNVANNIKQLKANALLVGITGEDDNSKTVYELLKKENIPFDLLENKAPTTTKMRIIGEHQQMVRLDFEETYQELPAPLQKALEAKINPAIGKSNLVILSDYGKGVCSPQLCQSVIRAANQSKSMTIVDPKGSDWEKYRHATVITPNVKELAEAAGKPVANNDADIEKAGLEIIIKYELQYLLVTRSEKGMSFISREQATHIATEAQEVYDVSGAGDTVVAALAVCLSSGMEWLESVKVANKAAGIVVSKFGTAPVKLEELEDSFAEKEHSKELSRQSLADRVNALKKAGKKIVFTNGCFDILHSGHVFYLRKAKELGDILVIGLNSDLSVKRLKGPKRPINSQKDRSEVMSALEFVDYITIFEEDTPHDLIKALAPDVLVKGGDYSVDKVVGREFAGETVIIPFLDGYSTTKIVEKMKEEKKCL